MKYLPVIPRKVSTLCKASIKLFETLITSKFGVVAQENSQTFLAAGISHVTQDNANFIQTWDFSVDTMNPLHAVVTEKFWNRWKTEYLTSLREFNKVSGHNKEVIKVGDVVIVHDEKPRMQWKLAVVEGLIKGGDNLVRAAHIRIGSYRTTCPIVKLYPLEVSDPDGVNPQESSDAVSTNGTRDSQSTVGGTSAELDSPIGQRPRRKAASKALENISKLSRALDDVDND